MNVADLIGKRFGIETEDRSSDPTSTVGVAATEILDNDPRRVAVVVVNLSANDLYIAWDMDVGATHGIYLAPNGGSFSMNCEVDFMLTTRKMFALAGGAGSVVFRQEVLISREVKTEV